MLLLICGMLSIAGQAIVLVSNLRNSKRCDEPRSKSYLNGIVFSVHRKQPILYTHALVKSRMNILEWLIGQLRPSNWVDKPWRYGQERNFLSDIVTKAVVF